FWTNENCVPLSDHSNNYGSSKLLLLDKIPLLKFNIFRINGEADPVVESERYSTILQLELPSENGLPCFDFIILDVGEDGHTAGIFKDNLDLFNTNKLTAQTFNASKGITNITITGSVINNSKEVAFIAGGERRAGVIAKILNDTEVSTQYPAANVKPKSEMFYWFLDRDSSSYFNFE
ncbi:MAG: 6-phosphogluconolactonase, partial [Ignavibacteriaceae bacterium]|nr:6-phosphogluconolactonase [Ignavibacteriaceae bacterium]